MPKEKDRDAVDAQKIQINWRILKKVLEALKADADQQGFSSIPALVNHILTVHYFGDKNLKKKEE